MLEESSGWLALWQEGNLRTVIEAPPGGYNQYRRMCYGTQSKEGAPPGEEVTGPSLLRPLHFFLHLAAPHIPLSPASPLTGGQC